MPYFATSLLLQNLSMTKIIVHPLGYRIVKEQDDFLKRRSPALIGLFSPTLGLASYISNRSRCIIFGGCTSPPLTDSPQSSTLRPLLFSSFVNEISLFLLVPACSIPTTSSCLTLFPRLRGTLSSSISTASKSPIGLPNSRA